MRHETGLDVFNRLSRGIRDNKRLPLWGKDSLNQNRVLPPEQSKLIEELFAKLMEMNAIEAVEVAVHFKGNYDYFQAERRGVAAKDMGDAEVVSEAGVDPP